MAPDYTIHASHTPEHLPALTSLFLAYTAWLDIDLAFQAFDTELASLPGKYAPPRGGVWIAYGVLKDCRPSEQSAPESIAGALGDVLGCVALRPLPALGPRVCELKRLYVVPAARGGGVGDALLKAALEAAGEKGYGVVKLDTLGGAKMQGARRMYARWGFQECAGYGDGAGVEKDGVGGWGLVFMEKELDGGLPEPCNG